ncbi:MAG: putative dithiol-disulfide oxidoreductase (DUF899 family) [Candidatus Promineifilaceae bacterium]|jgi:predicted dithiol-disulfide oxidoreductase (DUF899 family)
MKNQKIVSRDEWLAARTAYLAKEKEFTKQRDQLSQERRELPWVKLDKEYQFDGPEGAESLADLFDGRSQLIVYHFMYGPDWKEGCPSCSFWADNYNNVVVHLNQRDISMITVSRSDLANLEAYKKRMGWNFKWVSSLKNDFNYDFHVSATADQLAAKAMVYNYQNTTGWAAEEMPGISVFCKNESGEIFHTYSTYSRGLDMLNGAYHYMDLVPKGRDENDLPHTMAWLKRNDSYELV